MFCDLWQEDDGSPKPEHKWPPEDFWTSEGYLKRWYWSKDELQTETSSESEDELETGTSIESGDELETGTSIESGDELETGTSSESEDDQGPGD